MSSHYVTKLLAERMSLCGVCHSRLIKVGKSIFNYQLALKIDFMSVYEFRFSLEKKKAKIEGRKK